MVKGKTAKLVFAALMAAMALGALYLGALLPTGRLGFAALGSLFLFAALWEAELRGALLAYAAAALLGFLLVPEKLVVLLFALFFGPYPALCALTERLRQVWLRWLIKILFFCAALTALVFLLSVTVTDLIRQELPLLVVYAAGAAALVVFDFCVSKLALWWQGRFHKKTTSDWSGVL